MDRGHKYTDRRIELLEKQLDRHYRKVSDEAKTHLKAYLIDQEDEIKDMQERLDNGEKVDVEGYIYKNMKGEIDKLTDIYVKADQQAMSIIGASMGAIVAYNYNDTAERIRKKTGIQIPLKKNVTR